MIVVDDVETSETGLIPIMDLTDEGEEESEEEEERRDWATGENDYNGHRVAIFE